MSRAVGPSGTARLRAQAPWRSVVAVALCSLVVHGVLQWLLPGFADRDAWFHSRYAELLGRAEIPWEGTSFPWLTESAYADNPIDWSLLWHALLAPFTVALGPVLGLRTFTVVQAAALTTAFYALLRNHRVVAPLAWTTLFAAASPDWLFRVHFGRPTPFVLATMLLLVDLVLRRKDRLAALTVIVSLLSYHVPAPIVLAGGAAWLGRSLDNRRPDWPCAGHLVGAGVAAILLQPGFWDGGTLHVWRLMAGSLDVAAAGGRVDAGNGITLGLPLPRELGRPGLAGMVREFWPAAVATAVATAAALRAGLRGAPVAGAALSLVGMFATWRSGRFSEYWQALSFAGAALALTGVGSWARTRAPARAVGVLAALAVPFCAAGLSPLVRSEHADDGANVAPALAAIHAHSRPGDVVWHLAWDDFAPLFHFGADLRYVQGMDPWWCAARDLEGTLAHVLAANGELEGDALREVLISRFRARFVVLWSQREDGPAGDERRERVASRLRAVPWAVELQHDAHTTVFELMRR